MQWRGRWISEFEASLVYRVSSRTARDTQRNPFSKKQNKTTKKESGCIEEEMCISSHRKAGCRRSRPMVLCPVTSQCVIREPYGPVTPQCVICVKGKRRTKGQILLTCTQRMFCGASWSCRAYVCPGSLQRCAAVCPFLF